MGRWERRGHVGVRRGRWGAIKETATNVRRLGVGAEERGGVGGRGGIVGQCFTMFMACVL